MPIKCYQLCYNKSKRYHTLPQVLKQRFQDLFWTSSLLRGKENLRFLLVLPSSAFAPSCDDWQAAWCLACRADTQ